MILTKANEPTIQIVHPFVTGIIPKLDRLEDGSSITLLNILFKTDILGSRKNLFESQPMFELFVQAAYF